MIAEIIPVNKSLRDYYSQISGYELMPVKDEYVGEHNVIATPMQRRIEDVVTNGRAYLSIGGSMKLVNDAVDKFERASSMLAKITSPRREQVLVHYVPRISLAEVLDAGVAPLNIVMKPSLYGERHFDNPVGEVSLGRSGKCILPIPPFRSFTVQESVARVQAEKMMNNASSYISMGL